MLISQKLLSTAGILIAFTSRTVFKYSNNYINLTKEVKRGNKWFNCLLSHAKSLICSKDHVERKHFVSMSLSSVKQQRTTTFMVQEATDLALW